MRNYQQLTRDERYQIQVLLRQGLAVRALSRALKRAPSTIGRELRRNRGGRGYRFKQALRLRWQRRRSAIRTRIGAALWRRVFACIRNDWSPEQISGRLRLEGIRISHEWIYQRILLDKRAGGDLWRHLRCQKQRRKRYGRYDRRGLLPGRVGIEQRPAVVERRSRLGDWEVDTVLGRKTRGPVVLTAVERKSRYTRLALLPGCTAAAARRGLITRLRGEMPVKTLTADNGREFAQHARVARALQAKFYFARPYHSWERGLNENTNGLVRQYLQKGSDFGLLSKAQVRHIEQRLNRRPRKCLGYQTPEEVIFR